MKNIVVLAISILASLLLSCRSGDHSAERDRINFGESNLHMQDSLLKITALIEKFPNYGVKGYYIDHKGQIVINQVNHGSLSDLINGKKNITSTNLAVSDNTAFVSLVQYLKEHHINSSHYESSVGYFLFGYRAPKIESVTNLRFVTLSKGEDKQLLRYFKIIDRSEGMVLVMSNKSEYEEK